MRYSFQGLARGTRVAMRGLMVSLVFAVLPSLVAAAVFVATLRLRGQRLR